MCTTLFDAIFFYATYTTVVTYYKQTDTHSWQWHWRSCAPGCPRCWPLCSCRIRRRREWRRAGSVSVLGPGRWGGGAPGNEPRWQWELGIPPWCRRTAANPGRDPPLLCRSPTAGSLEALEGRDRGGGTPGSNSCLILKKKLWQTNKK